MPRSSENQDDFPTLPLIVADEFVQQGILLTVLELKKKCDKNIISKEDTVLMPLIDADTI